MKAEFELDNGVALFDVEHFHPGERETRDEPATGPEIDLADMGVFTSDAGDRSAFRMDDLVEAYAAMHGISHGAAQEMIMIDAVEQVVDDLDSRYDDRDREDD